ncbi:MAG TPA: TetR/AcrR family transcriptional regulator [Candidatus Dormibacteraeota bacterium]
MARVSRRQREQEVIHAARRLFDSRGVHDAPIDAVARMAGLNKALIYRHFASKEELYVETTVAYLDELGHRLTAATADTTPAGRLAATAQRFARFCFEYPAFPNLALRLMREPLDELRARVSDAVMLRLGEAMARCLAAVAEPLRELGVEDPERLANVVYARCLGLLHLARVGWGVRVGSQGMPDLFPITEAEIERQCIQDILASAGWQGPIPSPQEEAQ